MWRDREGELTEALRQRKLGLANFALSFTRYSQYPMFPEAGRNEFGGLQHLYGWMGLVLRAP